MDASARRRKKLNCLRGIVVFERPEKNKPRIMATGFVARYNEKFAVFSNLSVVFQCATPIIKTIDGKILKYDRILIPNDKRNVLYFELSPSVDSELFKALEFQDDLSEEIDIKTPIRAFGCKSNHMTITSSKGKVTAIGPKCIEILSKVSYNTNGGPVLTKKTGKVLGAVSVLHLDRKSRTHSVVRIDTVEGFEPLDKNAFLKEIEIIKKAEKIPVIIKRVIKSYETAMKKMMDKVDRERGTTNIKPMKKKCVAVNAVIKRLSYKLRSLGDFEFDYFNERALAAKQRTAEIVENFEERMDADLTTLKKKLKDAREDDKLKLNKKL
jgi:hypothetical protein